MGWLLGEIDAFGKVHYVIRTTLQRLKEATSESSLGEKLAEDTFQDVVDIFNGFIPSRWCALSGPSAPPCTWPLNTWLSDFQSRFSHIEKVMDKGSERTPAYWLGAYFNPKRLIALVLQESMQTAEVKQSGTYESYVIKTELTGRDKDHLRDPPAEGIFIYGIYLWGCGWEKATGDLQDAPPTKNAPHSLPVIHVQGVPESEKPPMVGVDMQKTSQFQVPVFPSRITERDRIFDVDIEQREVSAARWALRGISCTLR